MRKILFGILITCALVSCKTSPKKVEAEPIVHEWMGKKIQFPNDYKCNQMSKDTIDIVCNSLFQSEYKVLLYVDSTGCSECRLKLFLWKQLIAESDSLFPGKLNFLIFIQPKDLKELNFLLKRDRFDYPVFIDAKNTINKLNYFPEQPQFQCFLLDKDNKVLALGNPVVNPKIWKIYKERITGEKSVKNEPQTTAKADKIVHNYGVIKKGSKNNAVFTITNIGSNPLIITRVIASCGCTNVNWDKRPIKSGEMATISVEMTPDEIGNFSKTIDVFGNFAESPIKLTLMGQVE